jgi:hypothetical protein
VKQFCIVGKTNTKFRKKKLYTCCERREEKRREEGESLYVDDSG